MKCFLHCDSVSGASYFQHRSSLTSVDFYLDLDADHNLLPYLSDIDVLKIPIPESQCELYCTC